MSFESMTSRHTVQEEAGAWEDRVKLSAQSIKVSNPGIQQIRRRLDNESGAWLGDTIVDAREPTPHGHEVLLMPVLREGELVMQMPGIDAIRDHCHSQLHAMPSVPGLGHSESDPLSLFRDLSVRKTRLISDAKGSRKEPT